MTDAGTAQLIQLLQKQLEAQKQQMEAQQQQMEAQQIAAQRREEALLEAAQRREEALQQTLEKVLHGEKKVETASIVMPPPNFEPFDSSCELWPRYWARFQTFVAANSVQEDRMAQIFLTNQTKDVYELLDNLAKQQQPPKELNDLTMDEIVEYMKTQYDPKRFVVHERFKFWSDMRRKPGETLMELAARIRKKAATCDFSSIKDPLDEALRLCFICSVNNEAVLKALFKVKDDELNFARAVEIATETEDTAKIAKDTVYGSHPTPVNKVVHRNNKGQTFNSGKKVTDSSKPIGSCYRCGRTDHRTDNCRFKDAECNFCKNKGHLEKACRKKQASVKGARAQIKLIHGVNAVNGQESSPKLEVPIEIEGKTFKMELDTATTGNFISKQYWEDLGSPALDNSIWRYESASKHDLPIMGSFVGKAATQGSTEQHDVQFTVSEIPDLNLLGRIATKQLGISVDKVLNAAEPCNAVFSELKADKKLQERCRALCDEFPNLWKQELGCLKDFELEVKFKDNARPIFRKARPVPFAMEEAMEEKYEEGIAKDIWEYTQFNDYGTPVVPVKKPLLPGQQKAKVRICGDYSVTVNPQLEDHRHPLPLPEDLMRRLGGGYGFTKIDLADAYNQIKLAPSSQRRLALSTHKGVLLQKRLPFGIKSAPGYFQQIMDQLTKDLSGTAVYLDDILVSGKDADDHIQNLRGVLKRLDEKGLRCRIEKCQFALPYVEYLGHLLSQEGIAKGPKVDAVLKMPPPTNVSSLKAFLGSVQFYAKFLPPNLSTISEPLYALTKKKAQWNWEEKHQKAFEDLKDLLSSENVLVHFDSKLPLGLSCDASNVGIGAVLFHRFPDGSERPIANVSKTLTACQRNYSQIQKEAFAIVFGLRKFYQYLYGRRFILVTDHRPLLAMFGPGKDIPMLAANRLARWALWLNQFNYHIEYRKTSDHANADALSRLPGGDDPQFDGEESADDTEMVCAINMISEKMAPSDQESLRRESAKDPVISMVLRFTREGWPQKKSSEGSEMQRYRQLAESLSICNGCLVYGSRVVIPSSLRQKVLDLLHLGHFGMQRMKQLARTSVYWPNIDVDIESTCRHCVPCGEHQNKPSKLPVHPWMLPEKPWSRLHLDHAINFMGTNWLIMVDAYSKYPCIHPTSSVSAKATIDLLEQDFAHFGNPHTLVTDNASAFKSEEFQNWCNERGIVHLTGAPYHPATNGSAERLVQTFKGALRKSSLPPKKALQEFLMQYRRTPNSSGYSPSELLNSRQIRTRIDALLPSPAHTAQGKQSRMATKSQRQETVSKVVRSFSVGDPVYALYFGPRQDKQGRWVPAVITKRTGTRTVNVRVFPNGPTWRRHLEQLQPRYVSAEDFEPGDTPTTRASPETQMDSSRSETSKQEVTKRPPDHVPEYGPHNLRRSKRVPKPVRRFTPS